jgi:hypothetical protein
VYEELMDGECGEQKNYLIELFHYIPAFLLPGSRRKEKRFTGPVEFHDGL